MKLKLPALAAAITLLEILLYRVFIPNQLGIKAGTLIIASLYALNLLVLKSELDW